jgi:phosphate transport system permease protein
MAQVSPPAPDGGFSLKGQQSRNLRENIIATLLFLCGAFSVLVTLMIITALFGDTIGFFARDEVTLIGFLTGTSWSPLAISPSPDDFGVLPLVNGTLMIAVLASFIALPVGLASAIYLSEYARPNIRSTIKPLLEILAGVPTVVYGYFAISVITPYVRRLADAINAAYGTNIEVNFFNAFAGAVVVGILVIPMVASISEDAMRSVPQSLRQGSFALGATKFETSVRVVVPAALSGILAAFILAISRAIGETMAVTIAAGSTPRMTLNPLDSIQTMTAFIVQVSFGDAPAGSINGQSIFAVGATLFLMTFTMNLISDVILRSFREEYE